MYGYFKRQISVITHKKTSEEIKACEKNWSCFYSSRKWSYKEKLNHKTKWYLKKKPKPRIIQEKEMYQILWESEILTYHQLPARRPDLMLINKKREFVLCLDFTVPTDHWRTTKESENLDKFLDLARELKRWGT